MNHARIHKKAVTAMAITPDEKTFISAGDEGIVAIYDLATGACRKKLRFNDFPWASAALALAVTPDGTKLISGHRDNLVRVHELPSGRHIQDLHGHEGRSSINPVDGEESFSSGVVRCVDVSPDGRYAISGSDDETLRVWNIADGACLQVIKVELEMSAVAISPDGSTFVTGGFDRSLRSFPRGAKIRTFAGRKNLSKAEAIVFDPHGKWVVTAHPKAFNYDNHDKEEENALLLWNPKTGEREGICLFPLIYHLCLDVSPGGRYLVSNAADQGVIVWEMPAFKKIQAFGKGKITAVLWARKNILAGDEQGNISDFPIDVAEE